MLTGRLYAIVTAKVPFFLIGGGKSQVEGKLHGYLECY
jgi:hypothetical protein